jgi:geranylgeranyl pyrophosphate synthase
MQAMKSAPQLAVVSARPAAVRGPVTFEALASIEAELALVERELVETIPESLGLVSQASRRLMRSGGKRLRPALVLLAARAFGGITPRTIEVASALEMIHAASLVHDDVVDNATTRRGHVTVGAYWNNKIAVMLGDYLFTRSLVEMSREDTLPLTRIVSEATGRMVLGQIREIEHQNNPEVSLDDYYYIIREKTAALIAVCCRVGAILGKAPAMAVDRLEQYGIYLGMAFQVVDDCLDYWGQEDVIGKPVGSDLAERKFTLPFIYGLKVASPAQRQELIELVQGGQERLGRRAVKRILHILDKVGAREHSRSVALDFCNRARRALHEANPLTGVAELESLLDYVVDRTL